MLLCSYDSALSGTAGVDSASAIWIVGAAVVMTDHGSGLVGGLIDGVDLHAAPVKPGSRAWKSVSLEEKVEPLTGLMRCCVEA